MASNLERNGSVSWEFYGGQYTITGAINMSGTVNPGGQALVFSFQNLNNDGVVLDVRLDVATLFPHLGINYTADLTGTVISDGPNEAVVQWFASVDPNICAPVNISGTEVQAQITHLEGGLRGRVVPVDCQPE
ncbi:MAG: hypothetical protein C4336_08230 [Armatimonadota bacterium]